MNDLNDLLREIITHSDDDTIRLVYADALEEQGGEKNSIHAEWIRKQVAIGLRDTITIGGKEATRIALDRDYRDVVSRSPFALLELTSGTTNAQYGLPRTLFGIRIKVDPSITEPTGYDSVAAIHQKRDDPEYTLLRQEEWQLRQKLTWFDLLGELPVIVPVTEVEDWFQLRRGFVESMRLPADEFLRIVPQLHYHPSTGRPCPATAQPIRRVTLTTVPPDFEILLIGPLGGYQSTRVAHGIVKTARGVSNKVLLEARFPDIEFSFENSSHGDHDPNPGNADGDQDIIDAAYT